MLPGTQVGWSPRPGVPVARPGISDTRQQHSRAAHQAGGEEVGHRVGELAGAPKILRHLAARGRGGCEERPGALAAQSGLDDAGCLPAGGPGVAAQGGAQADGVRQKRGSNPSRACSGVGERPWWKCNQMQPNLKMAGCKLLKMVARDGIEPPTPAFSGLLTDCVKWFRISGSPWPNETYAKRLLALFGMTWAVFASSMFPYCSHESRRIPSGQACGGAHEGSTVPPRQHPRRHPGY